MKSTNNKSKKTKNTGLQKKRKKSSNSNTTSTRDNAISQILAMWPLVMQQLEEKKIQNEQHHLVEHNKEEIFMNEKIRKKKKF